MFILAMILIAAFMVTVIGIVSALENCNGYKEYPERLKRDLETEEHTKDRKERGR
jgi:hypothetical protein